MPRFYPVTAAPSTSEGYRFHPIDHPGRIYPREVAGTDPGSVDPPPPAPATLTATALSYQQIEVSWAGVDTDTLVGGVTPDQLLIYSPYSGSHEAVQTAPPSLSAAGGPVTIGNLALGAGEHTIEIRTGYMDGFLGMQLGPVQATATITIPEAPAPESYFRYNEGIQSFEWSNVFTWAEYGGIVALVIAPLDANGYPIRAEELIVSMNLTGTRLVENPKAGPWGIYGLFTWEDVNPTVMATTTIAEPVAPSPENFRIIDMQIADAAQAYAVLGWDPYPGATGYQVAFTQNLADTEPFSWYNANGNNLGLGLERHRLADQQGNQYKVWVRAVLAGGEYSGYSEIQFTLPASSPITVEAWASPVSMYEWSGGSQLTANVTGGGSGSGYTADWFLNGQHVGSGFSIWVDQPAGYYTYTVAVSDDSGNTGTAEVSVEFMSMEGGDPPPGG